MLVKLKLHAIHELIYRLRDQDIKVFPHQAHISPHPEDTTLSFLLRERLNLSTGAYQFSISFFNRCDELSNLP